MILTELLQNSDTVYYLLKFFLVISLLFVLRSLVKRDTENILSWIFGAVIFLLLRDLITMLIPNPALNALSDAFIPFFLVGAFLWRNERKRVLIFGIIIFILGIVSFVLSLIYQSLQALQGGTALLSGILAFLFLRGYEKAAQGKRILTPLGKTFLAIGIFLPPLFSFTGPEISLIMNNLGLPFAYLAFIIAALDYGVSGLSSLIAERDELTANIDTLYNFVLNSSDALRSGGDLTRLMNYVAKTLTSDTNADGSMVLMVDDFEDMVVSYALSGSVTPLSEVPETVPRTAEGIQQWLAELKVPLGEGIIGETAQNGKAVYLKDASVDSRIIIHPSFPVGSLIAVPFLIETRVIGVGVMIRHKGKDPFDDEDFDRASLLADFSSLVINNIYSFQDVTERSDIDTTAAIAEDIQKAMRPKHIPKHPALNIGIYSESARGVCSDYYDIIVARKDRVYLVIGDIAGKGIQAGLIMVMIRAIIHLVTNSDKDAATILSWINRGITGKIDMDHFATLQIIVMNPMTGTCEYANAGHKPLLIWKQSMGLVDAMDTESVPIGVEKTTLFKSSRFTLNPDDVMLLYTDGVIETINATGRQYGIKSLTSALHKFHELTPQEISKKIQDDIGTFIGDARQHDDQTVLVVKTRK